jgi:hypothetical protein
MNPIRWKRQDQVAGLAFCAVGAIAGIFFAWLDSPFRIPRRIRRMGRCSQYIFAVAVTRQSIVAVAAPGGARGCTSILRGTPQQSPLGPPKINPA